MITITREQAICIFFVKPYSEENVARLVPIIDNMDDLEICYKDDPTMPILEHVANIRSNPSMHHLYPPRYASQE